MLAVLQADLTPGDGWNNRRMRHLPGGLRIKEEEDIHGIPGRTRH